MHRSTSFRALVLFGVVALVTALCQSVTPPSSALTIPNGLTPRQRVKSGPVLIPWNSMRQPLFRQRLPLRHPPTHIGA